MFGKRIFMATLLIGAAPYAFAQMRAEAVPEAVLRPAHLLTTAPAVDVPSAAAMPRSALGNPRSESFAPNTTLPVSYSTTFLGSTLQLDMPRYDSGGNYVRPKFYVGMQSHTMRNWMNSTGLAADKCMLPMLRARTHLSGDGEVGGSLWVYARCTFH